MPAESSNNQFGPMSSMIFCFLFLVIDVYIFKISAHDILEIKNTSPSPGHVEAAVVQVTFLDSYQNTERCLRKRCTKYITVFMIDYL